MSFIQILVNSRIYRTTMIKNLIPTKKILHWIML